MLIENTFMETLNGSQANSPVSLASQHEALVDCILVELDVELVATCLKNLKGVG